jgi:Tfp pilus assembly protein PilN
MPLHVNLYHEIQSQERARQRDPFRLGMLAVLIVAIGFVGNYFVVLQRSHTIGNDYGSLQADLAKIAPQAKEAKAHQDELNAQITASDAMLKEVDGRFFWAPVLGEILEAVPRTVQITHVSADTPADEKGPMNTLSITGISGAPEPRKAAEALRIAINARLAERFKQVTSTFKALDDSDQYVMLDGKRMPTANFVMEFQIMAREPVVEATPPPAHKARAEAAE